MNVEQLLTEGTGFARLGMLDEAEALFQQIPATNQSAYLAAQNALLGIYISQGKKQRAADTGRLLILEGTYDVQTIVLTMSALTFAGRHEEGCQVLQLVEKFGRPVAVHAYQMACFDSLSGNFSKALRWLEIELQNPRYFSERSIGDSDLFPLWRWLASGQLTLQDAHRLLQMDLEGHCVAACDPNTEIRLDQNDLKGVSEEFQDLFRFNFTAGISELNPMAVARKAELARQFRADRARHVAKITSMIRAGTLRALDIVLDAQPKYAAAQAGSGNHLGARYHIVWALARKPELLGAFYSESGLATLYAFLDSLSEIQHVDPGFCARMDMLRTLIYADLEEAWKLLERTPRSVRSHPLFQLRQAMAYAGDTDYERALPIYLGLCETWPDDAALFANACDCLIRLGRWAEADAVLNRAPQCYQQFHVYYS